MSATPQKIRILCVDDHPLIRDGVIRMLDLEADMQVIASHQVTRVGASPLVIVSGIDELTDVVIGPKPGRPLLVGGASVAGVGAVAAVVGGVLLWQGVERFNEGKAALDSGDLQTAFEIRRDHEWLTPTGGFLVIVGAGVVVGGAGLVGIDLMGGDG